MKLKSLPEEARPRERLARLGPEKLSPQELIAILLRTGTREHSVLEVAANVIAEFPRRLLLRASYDELLKIAGIGDAKAVTLMAALELARRLNAEPLETIDLSTPAAVGAYLKEQYAHYPKEIFGIILSDNHNHLIRSKIIHEGTVQYTPVDPRFVFAPALNSHASRVILFHTHPSGDPAPSEDDAIFTKRLVQAGELLGIPIVDHFVVGVRGYYSFKEHRRI